MSLGEARDNGKTLAAACADEVQLGAGWIDTNDGVEDTKFNLFICFSLPYLVEEISCVCVVAIPIWITPILLLCWRRKFTL